MSRLARAGSPAPAALILATSGVDRAFARSVVCPSKGEEPRISLDAPLRREDEARATRAVITIAAGSATASLAMSFWMPFLPLYMRELGATSDANALFWVAIASMVQGIARLVASPLWGILADRYGRKLMFLRALYFASATMTIAAFATEPWHIVVAFGMQGLFSGFVPAATALVSVSVPDRRLSSSLSTVTGAEYIGSTIGPALGGVFAVLAGYRGAIVAAAALPAIAATVATFTVPRDQVGPQLRRDGEDGDEAAPSAPTSVRSLLTRQLVLALLVFFAVIALSQMLRLVTPVSLQRLAGSEGAAGAAGIAFSLGGLASIAGVFLAQRLGRTGRLQRMLWIACVVTGIAHLVLPVSGTVVAFIAAFTVISLLQAAMIPATNTLIAANSPRERRGTAFGLASGMQAVAFMVGPMAAAGFAAVSLNLGFVVLAVLFGALGVLTLLAIREPKL